MTPTKLLPATLSLPEGSRVVVVEDGGSCLTITRTRSKPWALQAGVFVVSLDGRTGGWLLSRCFVFPEEANV